MLTLAPATVADDPDIAALLDRAFGPARRARTAYRLRDGSAPLPGLSLVARDAGVLVGSVQLWPVRLREAGGRSHALTLLGPLAVAPERRGAGLGSALLTAALVRVDAAGIGPVVLIGDLDYYGRFGFSSAATQRWSLPGPVNRARVLLRGGGLPSVGVLEAAATARAALAA